MQRSVWWQVRLFGRAFQSTLSATRPVKGMRDKFGVDSRAAEHIKEVGKQVADLYDLEQISTPLLEHATVFKKTLGSDSDIVGKELYTFTDKGGEQLTLRPEGTAGVTRALLSNGLLKDMPKRYFYDGPMFRHERPQKGRYRQFDQIGVELFGGSDAHLDVEIIDMAHAFLARLGLAKHCELELNTLGDVESRRQYKSVLCDYLKSHRHELSEDSVRRIDTNPMRVLDSKHPRDQVIIQRAPQILDHLSSRSISRLDTIRNSLQSLKIPFTVNPRLVRGLDYYQETVFEFVYQESSASDGETRLGKQQGTVLAGGRYDGLVALMTGNKHHMPAIGWAAGIDRLAALLEPTSIRPRSAPLMIVPVFNPTNDSQNATISHYVTAIASYLRCKDVKVAIYRTVGNDTTSRPKFDKIMRDLLKDSKRLLPHDHPIRHVVFIGEEEVGQGDLMSLEACKVQCRDFEQREQRAMSVRELLDLLKQPY